MKKLNQKIFSAQDQAKAEERVESRLACFVNAVKTNLRSKMKKGSLTPATIKNAEKLEEKFKSWGCHRPNIQQSDDSGNRLYMDYLMHHRVSLATDILKSMANGRCLSQQREKVLRNSIDYIEQRL